MSDEALSPEELLARSIRHHRDERLHITAQQLAERVAELGGKLSRQAISKIETGGRSVSIDELMILAKALCTSPLLLLFPVGIRTDRIPGEVNVVPGKPYNVWDAARWFTGEAYMSGDVETHWAVPLFLYREHDKLIGDYIALLDGRLFPPDPADPDRLKERAQAEAKLRRLRDVRAEMRRHALAPPELDDDLRYIDERRHVYLTPERAEALAVEHPGSVRFLDHGPNARHREVRPGDAAAIRSAQEFARRFEAGQGDAEEPDESGR